LSFARLDDGSPLQSGQTRLVYRIKERGVQVGSGSFFFQEGYGVIFNGARFVEMRADPQTGETLITHLLDARREPILPGQQLNKAD